MSSRRRSGREEDVTSSPAAPLAEDVDKSPVKRVRREAPDPTTPSGPSTCPTGNAGGRMDSSLTASSEKNASKNALRLPVKDKELAPSRPGGGVAGRSPAATGVISPANAKPAEKPERSQSTSCPYLGMINRHMLDFDFEKLCSICLSNQHVYACLVCGKYFQGRGKNTYAYTHALEENHYVYIDLESCRFYCLPDDYEIIDASLGDIRYFLNPRYTPEEVATLDQRVVYGKALDGTDFLPGCIGLNNLKKTDYFNVVIQVLCVTSALRNGLMLLDLSYRQSPDPVLTTLSELLRKIYNPKNFKGIVSPHEFLQAVGVASGKKFRIGEQNDPVALLSWLIDRLHKKLRNSKTGRSVIHDTLQGEVLVTTTKGASGDTSASNQQETRVPFL
eukprot:GHVT01002133.1.p1 GENE.GHVT01002133.1~~GHVT01002133.1.p1  ORF type:complete len:390 (-),score=51.72 GHVT01002133.1:3387-4556(-)